MKVGFKLTKAMFFDRPVVKEMAGQARRVLSRFGSFVRTRARSLTNKKATKKRKVSAPGQPPLRQTGILRRFIYFAYDPASKSVVIGPAKTNQVFFDRDGQPVRGTVPEVLEYGGEIRILEAEYLIPGRRGQPAEKKWLRADLRSKRRIAALRRRMRTVRIAARPYMRPAFDKELPNLRKWRKAA